MKTLSVVIANYNYEVFLGRAIESALAIDWPDVQVVVVDDGSTDGSRQIIDSYGSRVDAIFTVNRGQREAVNTGFSESRGDVVIFLDADDELPSEMARQFATQWSPLVSKWQFRLQRIDESGALLGEAFPCLEESVTSSELQQWLINTSAYPTPPGSGNAYARWFLETVFPIPPEVGDAADSALLAVAPLAGAVIIMPQVLVRYRVHAGNDSHLMAAPGSRFLREVRRAEARWYYATEYAARLDPPIELDREALRKSRELLQFRAVAWRLRDRKTRTDSESTARLLVDILRSPVHPGPESKSKRAMILLFSLATVMLPRVLVPALLRRRFSRGAN